MERGFSGNPVALEHHINKADPTRPPDSIKYPRAFQPDLGCQASITPASSGVVASGHRLLRRARMGQALRPPRHKEI